MTTPKDNVLRALIHSKIEGQTGMHVVDAIDCGDTYKIVVDWARHKEKEGVSPLRSISAPKEDFEVVDHPDYELRCKQFVDLDSFFTKEPTEMDADEVWSKPEKLSIPPPDMQSRKQ